MLLLTATLAGAEAPPAVLAQAAPTIGYTCTGFPQPFSVPAGVSQLTMTVVGAAGSAGNNGGTAGSGAIVTGTLKVTPGHLLTLYVGCQGASPDGHGVTSGGWGFPSGGDGGASLSPGGGGGGATAVLDGSTVLMVAGGGGGSGGHGCCAGISGGDAGSASPSISSGAWSPGNPGGGSNAGLPGRPYLGQCTPDQAAAGVPLPNLAPIAGADGSSSGGGGGGGGGGYTSVNKQTAGVLACGSGGTGGGLGGGGGGGGAGGDNYVNSALVSSAIVAGPSTSANANGAQSQVSSGPLFAGLDGRVYLSGGGLSAAAQPGYVLCRDSSFWSVATAAAAATSGLFTEYQVPAGAAGVLVTAIGADGGSTASEVGGHGIGFSAALAGKGGDALGLKAGCGGREPGTSSLGSGDAPGGNGGAGLGVDGGNGGVGSLGKGSGAGGGGASGVLSSFIGNGGNFTLTAASGGGGGGSGAFGSGGRGGFAGEFGAAGTQAGAGGGGGTYDTGYISVNGGDGANSSSGGGGGGGGAGIASGFGGGGGDAGGGGGGGGGGGWSLTSGQGISHVAWIDTNGWRQTFKAWTIAEGTNGLPRARVGPNGEDGIVAVYPNWSAPPAVRGAVWTVTNTPTSAGNYALAGWPATAQGFTPLTGEAAHIAAGWDGQPWVVTAQNGLWRRAPHLPGSTYVAGGFEKIADNVRAAGVGANGQVWTVTTTAYGGGNYTISTYNQGSATWTTVDGGAVDIAVAPDGQPWVVSAANVLWRRPLVQGGYIDGTWQQVATGVRQVAIGADGSVYVVTTDTADSVGNYKVAFFNQSANSWPRLDGGATRVAVGPDGQPWVVTAAGLVWQRTKGSTSYLDGSWQQVPNATGIDIAVGAN